MSDREVTGTRSGFVDMPGDLALDLWKGFAETCVRETSKDASNIIHASLLGLRLTSISHRPRSCESHALDRSVL